ncbi:MAG: hypothetical protein D6753_11630 [Planctomycetota bacterium]|nr:MAG: hypothetical protein D6753_11630 [Planctomycetota bacterium]
MLNADGRLAFCAVSGTYAVSSDNLPEIDDFVGCVGIGNRSNCPLYFIRIPQMHPAIHNRVEVYESTARGVVYFALAISSSDFGTLYSWMPPSNPSVACENWRMLGNEFARRVRLPGNMCKWAAYAHEYSRLVDDRSLRLFGTEYFRASDPSSWATEVSCPVLSRGELWGFVEFTIGGEHKASPLGRHHPVLLQRDCREHTGGTASSRMELRLSETLQPLALVRTVHQSAFANTAWLDLIVREGNAFKQLIAVIDGDRITPMVEMPHLIGGPGFCRAAQCGESVVSAISFNDRECCVTISRMGGDALSVVLPEINPFSAACVRTPWNSIALIVDDSKAVLLSTKKKQTVTVRYLSF